MNILLIAALMTAVLLLLKVRASQPETSATRTATRPDRAKKTAGRQIKTEDPAFRAVEIKTGSAACKPARALEDARFLSRDAPITPLEGCTAAKCTCRYVHYDDRRQEFDRRDPLEAGWRAQEAMGATNRRSRRPRRRDDQAEQKLDLFSQLEFS